MLATKQQCKHREHTSLAKEFGEHSSRQLTENGANDMKKACNVCNEYIREQEETTEAIAKPVAHTADSSARHPLST